MAPDREIQRYDYTAKIGDYQDSYHGDPSLSGHIDAPHAQEMTPEMIENLIFSGQFDTNMGPKRPNSNQIYANQTFRRFLGKVPGESIDINGTTYKVRSAKIRTDSGKIARLTVHENQTREVAEFIAGKCRVDEQTGEITKAAIQRGASGIIGTINREFADINRFENKYPPLARIKKGAQEKAVDEYRAEKRALLQHMNALGTSDKPSYANKPYLHIALHGKKDFDSEQDRDCDIEIGTRNGKSANQDILNWFALRFANLVAEKGVRVNGNLPRIGVNDRFTGDASKLQGPMKHGFNYNTVQLEVGKSIRYQYGEEIAEILHQLLQEFTDQLKVEAIQNSSEIEEQLDSTRKKAIEVLETQIHDLIVSKTKIVDCDKNVVCMSPALARSLGVVNGDYVKMDTNANEGIFSVRVYDDVANNQIKLDQRNRGDFSVSPGENEIFKIRAMKQ